MDSEANIITYKTDFGLISLYKNEEYIGKAFEKGVYWSHDTMIKLRGYINPNKNILEIGGHCGTSSVFYHRFLHQGKKIYVYEPQKNMYDLLVRNIKQNNLQDKIYPSHKAIFCYNGTASMNHQTIDGTTGDVKKRYSEESEIPCNFGGLSLGLGGEQTIVETVDSLNLDDIGFIHCDAQGSESFIFSKATETIKKNRPVIFFEDKAIHGELFHASVTVSYPMFMEESKFNIKDFCIKELGYRKCIEKFNNGLDSLLIP
jgi:FkbM family methyltransferase